VQKRFKKNLTKGLILATHFVFMRPVAQKLFFLLKRLRERQSTEDKDV
jgi:hypothetical protein